MANTFLLPTTIARAALATLYEQTVMASLVFRDYDADFAGKRGDTVTVRKPATFTALEYVRADGITIQDATEDGIPVVLNHLADVSFAVTTEQLTLEIDDFADKLLNPAMEAIVQKIDDDLLALRADVTQTVGTVTGEEWSKPQSLVGARRKLNQNHVPRQDRYAVVGPTIAGEWAKDSLMHQAQQRGDTEGLHEASLGKRLFGFEPYEHDGIYVPTPGTGIPTTEVGVAFHKTAFALVTRPLELPRGAAQAAVANYKGFGIRVVIDYDIDKKQDVVSLDTLYGVKTIDAARAVKIQGALG